MQLCSEQARSNLKTSRQLGSILSWLSSHKLAVLVVVGVVTDWLPSYLLGLPSGTISGTRLLVVPLVLLDMLRTPYSYLSVNYAVWYAFGLASVGAYSLVSGDGAGISVSSQVPNLLILMFFLKRRTNDELGKLLLVAVIAAFAVPVSLLLASTGVITPRVVVVELEFSRLLAGTNWSSLGLYFALIGATLGGRLLLTNLTGRAAWAAWIGSSTALVLTFWAVLLPAQRSSLVGFVLCFGISLLLSARVSSKLGFASLAVTALTVVLVSGALVSGLAEASSTSMMYRLATTQDDDSTDSRLATYQAFVDDVTNSPSFLADPSDEHLQRSGGRPHFIIGEAYYHMGGLLFALIIAAGFGVAAARVIHFWWRASTDADRLLAVALLSTFVGFAINLATHPGLSTRIVYMLLGFWLAANRGSSYVTSQSWRYSTPSYSDSTP